jgi:hypothetical protein
MKGRAMKLGQMASLIDSSRLRGDEVGELRARLAASRDSSR